MATVPRILCDLCHGEKDVRLVTVKLDGRSPWEADICAGCYEQQFGPLSRKGRKASRSNVRPQHSFRKLPDEAIRL